MINSALYGSELIFIVVKNIEVDIPVADGTFFHFCFKVDRLGTEKDGNIT